MKEYGFLLHNNEKQTMETIIIKAEKCEVQFPYWDEESKRVAIRYQHWRELLIDNGKCMNELIAQGEDPSGFCPNCHHFLTQEELDNEECACCQTQFESCWDEEEEY